MRVRTLLQRLHGGGGLQWDQALSLEVEDMLLLKLLHLDELLLEGQLLCPELLLARGQRDRKYGPVLGFGILLTMDGIK